MVANLRDMLLGELPAACADPMRREALDLLLSFESWSRLRREQGLTREIALAVVLSAASKVLGPDIS